MFGGTAFGDIRLGIAYSHDNVRRFVGVVVGVSGWLKEREGDVSCLLSD